MKKFTLLLPSNISIYFFFLLSERSIEAWIAFIIIKWFEWAMNIEGVHIYIQDEWFILGHTQCFIMELSTMTVLQDWCDKIINFQFGWAMGMCLSVDYTYASPYLNSLSITFVFFSLSLSYRPLSQAPDNNFIADFEANDPLFEMLLSIFFLFVLDSGFGTLIHHFVQTYYSFLLCVCMCVL